MKIKSLVLTAMMGLGTLTLAGCVDGGGYSGAYVTSYSGPYYGGGFYDGYGGDGFYRDYRGYRRDGRYYRSGYGDHRRDYGNRGRGNDRPRGPGRDYHRDGGGNNGRVILPNPDSPRGPMFSRGGN